MRKNNDIMLLESLVRKYGKNGIKNAIKKINEDMDEYSDYTDESLLKEIVDKYGKKTILDILNTFDAMIRHI